MLDYEPNSIHPGPNLIGNELDVGSDFLVRRAYRIAMV